MDYSAIVGLAVLVALWVAAAVLFEKRPPVPFRDRLIRPYVVLNASATWAFFYMWGLAWPIVVGVAVLCILTTWSLLRSMRTCSACHTITVSQDLLRPAKACRSCGRPLVEDPTVQCPNTGGPTSG
jgi:hypothetical protein